MEEKQERAMKEITEEHKARMRQRWMDEKIYHEVLERIYSKRAEQVREGRLHFDNTAEEEAKEWYFE